MYKYVTKFIYKDDKKLIHDFETHIEQIYIKNILKFIIFFSRLKRNSDYLLFLHDYYCLSGNLKLLLLYLFCRLRNCNKN